VPSKHLVAGSIPAGRTDPVSFRTFGLGAVGLVGILKIGWVSLRGGLDVVDAGAIEGGVAAAGPAARVCYLPEGPQTIPYRAG